ncbi:hypothetical protein [Variovorax sp. HW608]|uniref:hypothetical protein n=1 Tax=Variovorax sp. HW608 TaxID=1034889 RepID=UPI0012FD5A04|nr:hypothetical protein [Variovorax sp. HW608]
MINVDKRDLEEFSSALLVGITIGAGSIAMIFSSDASLLIQCPFKCTNGDVVLSGNGEEPSSSFLLIGYLNKKVRKSEYIDGVFALEFETGEVLTVIPNRDGLESYVITNRFGVLPIAVL